MSQFARKLSKSISKITNRTFATVPPPRLFDYNTVTSRGILQSLSSKPIEFIMDKVSLSYIPTDNENIEPIIIQMDDLICKIPNIVTILNIINIKIRNNFNIKYY